MPAPSTDQFSSAAEAIAAELLAADPATRLALIAGERAPACLDGVDWASEWLDRGQVAELCGLKPKTITEYMHRARAGGPGPSGAFPLPEGTGTGARWAAGRLAVWAGIRASGLLHGGLRHAHSPKRQPWLTEQAAQALAAGVDPATFAAQAGISAATARNVYHDLGVPPRATMPAAALQQAVGVLLAASPRMPITAIAAALREQGQRVSTRRISQAIRDIGGRPIGPVYPYGENEWVRAAALARAAHVTPAAVARNAAAGRLTPVARDRSGCLYNPARVTAGQPGRVVPVDADWTPGDGSENFATDPVNETLLPVVRAMLTQAGDEPVTVPAVRRELAALGHDVSGRHAGMLLYLA